ncbi:ABC transporter substrate-binding protein [uncultured Amnibacterium sp.]|uniref:ABC transporter substrate-binding protein n=1 Tax=uncultured Amnibacterium sp. TaxID=1631851 RepID=UPI0035CB83F1
MSTQHRRPGRRIITAAAALTGAALALTACSGPSGGAGGTGAGPTSFTVLAVTNVPEIKTLTALSKGACAAADKALPLKFQTTSQAQMQQKVQLLAGQNGLPAMFDATGTPSVTEQLDKSGQLLDLTPELDELGVSDDVLPAAASTIKNLYGGNLNVVPTSLNIEGFWYNKAAFAKAGVEVPTTWQALVDASAKLQAAGYTPLSTGASGQGWPVTRLISGYLFRELGPSAMADVRDGKAKLTDPKYVAAAQAIADLGKKGYLGKSVGSVDYDTINSNFLTGKAAMMYMGSWALGGFEDPKQNQIGADDIGFFPYPAVDGGTGSIDQLPANVGEPIGLSKKLYGPKPAAWLKCIAQHYGATAIENGQISGFKVNGSPKASALTQLVLDKIGSTQQSLVWFETYFNSKASTVSWNNVASLVDGKQSASQFMSLIQAAL